MTQFGELALWIALLMAAWCTTLAVQGAVTRRGSLVESAARGLQMALVFSAVSAGVLMRAFLDGDYSLRYVAMHSGSSVADAYKISAFWMGRAGLLLLTSVALAAAGLIGARSAIRRDGDRARSALTLALLGAGTGAALAVTAFSGSVFALFNQVPGDGRGLDPLFRDPLGVIQPVVMVLGVATAAVPLALLAAAALRRRIDDDLIARVRSSATIAWTLLAAAAFLGAQWAYVTPGLRVRVQGTPIVIGAAGSFAVMTVVLLAIAQRARRTALQTPRRKAAWAIVAAGAVIFSLPRVVGGPAKNYDVQIEDGSRYTATDAWGHTWVFTSQGESRIERPGDDVTALGLLPTRDGARQPFLSAESRQYYAAGGLDIYPPQTVPAVRRGFTQDLFVVLADAQEGHSVIRISFRPLVTLAWIGALMVIAGAALLCWAPRPERAS